MMSGEKVKRTNSRTLITQSDRKKTSVMVIIIVCVCVCVQVWQIRVDVHMLNHDGNLMDAASIAAITALCHFRRPDVSIQGEEVTVVSRPQPLTTVLSNARGF